MMKTANETKLFPRQLAMLVLASAIAIPVCAQDQVSTGTSSGVTTQSQSTTTTSRSALPNAHDRAALGSRKRRGSGAASILSLARSG